MYASEDHRRRFYTVEADLRRNPSDLEFVNQAEVLRHSSVPGAYIRAGMHHHALEGLGAPLCFGLPVLRGKPALIVGVNEDEGDLLDIYGLSERYVSPRAKELLYSIDPDAFEFAECATVDGSGRPLEPYWMMDVIRVVEQWDETRSKIFGIASYVQMIQISRKIPSLPGCRTSTFRQFLEASTPFTCSAIPITSYLMRPS